MMNKHTSLYSRIYKAFLKLEDTMVIKLWVCPLRALVQLFKWNKAGKMRRLKALCQTPGIFCNFSDEEPDSKWSF